MALVIALLLVGVSILLHWADAHREREHVRQLVERSTCEADGKECPLRGISSEHCDRACAKRSTKRKGEL